MKIRNGFVSNSSSSSFIILKKYLTDKQIVSIRNHKEVGILIDSKIGDEGDNAWNMIEDQDLIGAETSMDNFDMRLFLDKIHVDYKHIKWGWWRYTDES